MLVLGAIKFNLLSGLEIDTNDINKEINVIAVKAVINENIIPEIFLLSFLFLSLSAIFGELRKACMLVITLIDKNWMNTRVLTLSAPIKLAHTNELIIPVTK